MYKFFSLKGDKKFYEVCNDFDKRTDGRTDRICLPFSAMQQEEQNNDGVGFDVDKQIEDGHYGIVGNRKRLEHFVNGTLDIESEVGKGTTAVIKIPIEKK